MTRSHPLPITLPVFIALGIVVAVLAFGATRWLTQARSSTLPALDVAVDADASRSGALDAQRLFATRAPATVMIDATVNGAGKTGAGVIVDAKNGTIVTASHVIYDYDTNAAASSIIVSLSDDGMGVRDEIPARLVARDRYNDLAVLEIDPTRASRPLVAARLSDSALAIGADVAAIGYPLGEQWTLTVGTVSNVHRTTPSRINPTWNIPDAVQFDAPINPGNSGGPLFDARGNVVGIVQQISSSTDSNTGVSFAVSAPIVQRALRIAASGRTEIPAAWTGLATRTLSPQLAHAVGAARAGGALVQTAEGPAAQAGISAGRSVAYAGGAVQAGDVIVGFAGQRIASSQQLDRLLGLLEPGTRVEVIVRRDGHERTLQLEPQLAA